MAAVPLVIRVLADTSPRFKRAMALLDRITALSAIESAIALDDPSAPQRIEAYVDQTVDHLRSNPVL